MGITSKFFIFSFEDSADPDQRRKSTDQVTHIFQIHDQSIVIISL